MHQVESFLLGSLIALGVFVAWFGVLGFFYVATHIIGVRRRD